MADATVAEAVMESVNATVEAVANATAETVDALAPSAATATPTALFVALGALGTMATATIYFGSLSAANDEPDENVEEISTESAKWMPIRGSMVLFGLYLLLRYLPAEYLHLALSAFMALMGAFSVADSVYRWLAAVYPRVTTLSTPFHLQLTQGDEVYLDETFDYPYMGLLALGLGVAGAYLGWKHWLLTNILSTALALQTLRLLKLDTFTTGMVLLAGLFVYDIFWVFGTDVMVTVAKGFDAPIKIVFPTADYLAATPKLAMLGLGDIIVPGIFIVLALRFDRRHLTVHGNQPYAKPYFTATLTAYMLGLLTTFGVMYVFKAAQPALLYLSPACILAVLLTGFLRGELHAVWSYTTSSVDAVAEKPAGGAVPKPTAAAPASPITETKRRRKPTSRSKPKSS